MRFFENPFAYKSIIYRNISATLSSLYAKCACVLFTFGNPWRRLYRFFYVLFLLFFFSYYDYRSIEKLFISSYTMFLFVLSAPRITYITCIIIYLFVFVFCIFLFSYIACLPFCAFSGSWYGLFCVQFYLFLSLSPPIWGKPSTFTVVRCSEWMLSLVRCVVYILLYTFHSIRSNNTDILPISPRIKRMHIEHSHTRTPIPHTGIYAVFISIFTHFANRIFIMHYLCHYWEGDRT